TRSPKTKMNRLHRWVPPRLCEPRLPANRCCGPVSDRSGWQGYNPLRPCRATMAGKRSRGRQARKMREPTQRPALRSLPPWFGAVAFLCASAFYVTAILPSPPLVGLYHDDGIYIGSALSLARGDGYRIPHLPGSPLQAKYPPLYPLVLLPIAWIVGNSPTAIGLYR